MNDDDKVELEDDDTILMVLSPDFSFHIPSAVLIDADCGHKCWISPSAKKMADDPKVSTVLKCMPCALAEPGVLDKIRDEGFVSSPDAREELNKALGTAVTDQLWAQLNIKELKHD